MSALVNIEQSGFTLVLGGQRSGKSLFAEQLVENVGGGFYLATSESGDTEMVERILVHQKRRGNLWQTIEEPILLSETLLSLKVLRNQL